MTNREKLHHLIDDLSEPDVDEALQYITWQQENGFAHLLHALPEEHSAGEEKTGAETPGDLIFLDDVKRGQGFQPSFGS